MCLELIFYQLYKNRIEQVFAPLLGWKSRKLDAGQVRDDIAAYMMPPRYVITDPERTEEYVAYHRTHLPDTSHFPTHDPKRTHFWQMGKGVNVGKRGKKLKGGKARAKAHSILTG